VIPKEEDLLAEMEKPGFNPREEVLLDREPGFPPDAGAEYSGEEPRAEVATYRPEEVRVNVALPRRGLLVLTDTWFPGWRATVPGGPEAPPLRADHAFRAVPLGAGVGTVTFTYDPFTFGAGLYLSLVLTVFTVALLGYRAFRRPGLMDHRAPADAGVGPNPARAATGTTSQARS
jgi:hypothetical protein